MDSVFARRSWKALMAKYTWMKNTIKELNLSLKFIVMKAVTLVDLAILWIIIVKNLSAKNK